MSTPYLPPQDYGKLGLTEIVPLVARLLTLVLKLVGKATWYPLSRSRWTFKRYLWRTFVGTMLPNSTVRQLQFVLPSTGTLYAQYQASLPGKPAVVSESIGHDAWVHWIGPKSNKKVMYYIHGGGFVMPASDGHLKMVDWWRTEAKKRHDVDFSVAVLEYSLANFAPWPTQLIQVTAGLSHLLEQGYDPADITVAGDSAGGLEVLFLLGHLLHPHPDAQPIELARPLAGAASLSAWLTFETDSGSWRQIGDNDVVAPRSALQRWAKMISDGRERKDDTNYFEPAKADASWWAGLGKVASNLLMTVGEVEGMLDDIVATKKRLEEGAGPAVKLSLFTQVKAEHNEALVDFACGDQPGPTNARVISWIEEVYA